MILALLWSMDSWESLDGFAVNKDVQPKVGYVILMLLLFSIVPKR